MSLSQIMPLWILLVLSIQNSVSFTAMSEWSALNPESLVSAPCLIEQTLCVATDSEPQRAKDLDYAKAVLGIWKEEEESSWDAEITKISYGDDNELHGYLVAKDHQKIEDLPVVLFFHTGAGPHDIFLFYKAVALVQQLECVVMICDVLGDETGWAWDSDRTRYDQARQELLAANDSIRPLLQKRIMNAVEVSKELVGSDSELGALGWCLGGHSVLELGRMCLPQVKAMATFHGVFDNLPPPSKDGGPPGADILLCHGVNDPFVSDESLERALETLQNKRHRTSLLQLPAKHGFTNPAQDFNPNDAFAFEAESAAKAWRQAVGLLKRALN